MLSSFTDVGTQVLVLFILIGVGALLTKVGLITDKGSRTMTDVVLYAVTPCVIINAFQREYQPEMLTGLLIALLAAFLSLGFSVILAEILYRKKDISRGVVLKFAVVFSNCGFMALPLQKAILGEDGVFYGAAFVAMFNIFMWTYGLIAMSGKTKLRAALKTVVNPGIIGTVIGVVFFVFSVKLPTVILSPVSMLASLNTPVPMLVIGYHLMHSDLRKVLKDKDAYIAMALRLIVLPLAEDRRDDHDGDGDRGQLACRGVYHDDGDKVRTGYRAIGGDRLRVGAVLAVDDAACRRADAISGQLTLYKNHKDMIL